MSHNNNFKKNQCWSCEYFSGKREYKNGFLCPSVENEYQGTCSCKYGPKFNKKILENEWCLKYQKWGVLLSYLTAEANKKEQEKVNKEIEKSYKKEQEEIEQKRRRLEYERREIEHQKFIASLTPEQLIAYKEKKEKEEKEFKTWREKQKTINIKRKLKAWIITISTIIITAIVISIVLVKVLDSSNYDNTPEGKLRKFINTNGKNDTYQDRLVGNDTSVSYNLTYNSKGYGEGYGNRMYQLNGDNKFLLEISVDKMPEKISSNLAASIIFNYENINDYNKVICCSEVYFGVNSVIHHYQAVDASNPDNPTYTSVWNVYGIWDSSLDIETSYKEGFKAVSYGIKLLNRLSNVVR